MEGVFIFLGGGRDVNVVPPNYYGIGSWGSAIIVLIIAFYILMHSLPLLLLREQLDNSVRSTLARTF